MDLRAITPVFGRGFGSFEYPMLSHGNYLSAFFNGLNTTGQTYTGGILRVADNLGVDHAIAANVPAIRGARHIYTGTELIRDDGWVSPLGGWVISDDVMSMSLTSSYLPLAQDLGLIASKTYVISFEVLSLTGIIKIALDTAPNYSSNTIISTISAVGEYTYIVSGTEPSIIFSRNSGSTASCSIGSISVKEIISQFYDTTSEGTPILASTTQRLTDGSTVKRYSETDPTLLFGQLFAPARTNYALNSATPATHTTGIVPAGTYTLWQEGTGSIVATNGTAVGIFGTASNGTPATITITTGGTVVLTASGTNTWVQLEGGFLKTPKITTTTASVTRASTVASYSSTGKIQSNDIAFLITATPTASEQSCVLFHSGTDRQNCLTVHLFHSYIAIRKYSGGSVVDAFVDYTHTAGVPIEIIASISSTVGMRVSVREYSGGAWSTWSDGDAVLDTTNALTASTYYLGNQLSTEQFFGYIHQFSTLFVPPSVANPQVYARKAFAYTESTGVFQGLRSLMTFNVIGTTVSGTLSTVGDITVNWGDGTSNTYNGTDVAFSKIYSVSSSYKVNFTGNGTKLTKFNMPDAGANISGTLSIPTSLTYFSCTGSNTLSGTLSMPSSLTSFSCYGSNTLSGPLSMPSSLTTFSCGGSNTLSGTLSMPSSLTYFACYGSNTLSGTLNMPTGMTYFSCAGANTLSGTLSIPTSLTYFYCTGSNTLSGTLSIPTSLTYFACTGSNTLSGTLSMPSSLTYFACYGSNTLSGTLSMPSSLTYFACTGSNTLSGYIRSTKSNNQSRFQLEGLNTMSSTDVDNILLDYAEVTTWSGYKTFILQGNASNRTSTSDAAYATLQTKGLTTLSVD